MAVISLFSVALAEPPASADKPQSPAKTLRVAKTDDFELTGRGDSPAWQKASWTPLERRAGDGADYTTRIKVLYSATGLYVLMDATDAKITATMKEDYLQLWKEDVFELFLWSDTRYPLYFEYEISPLGYELPILIPNIDGKHRGWRPWEYEGSRKTRKATAAVGGPKAPGAKVTGWNAEVFIPFDLLKPLANVPPKPGTQWRANFYRVDYDGGRRTNWDWVFVGSNLHEFEKYGTLIFEE
jgi:hypothetical protein